MGTRAAGIVVASRGITVEKRLVTDGIDGWVVVLTVSNSNDVPVGVRLFETLPEGLDPAHVSFDDAHHGNCWEVHADGQLEFGITVAPNEDRRTGYALPPDTVPQEQLVEPLEVANVVPLPGSEEGEQPTTVSWSRATSGDQTDRSAEQGTDTGFQWPERSEAQKSPPPASERPDRQSERPERATTVEEPSEEITIGLSGRDEAGTGDEGSDGDDESGAIASDSEHASGRDDRDAGEADGSAESGVDDAEASSDEIPVDIERMASDIDDVEEDSPTHEGADDAAGEPERLSDELLDMLETGSAADDASGGLDRSGGDRPLERTHLITKLLEGLTGEVEDLVSYTDALESFLATESSAMDALEDVRGQVEELSNELTAIERELDTLTATVDDRGDRMTAMEGAVNELSSDVGAVRDRVQELTDDVERIEGETEAVEELEEQVRALKYRVEEAADDRRRMTDALEELGGAVEALDAKGASRDDRVSELESEVESVTATLGKLEGQLSEHRTAILELRTDVQEVQSVFGRLAEGLRSMEPSSPAESGESGLLGAERPDVTSEATVDESSNAGEGSDGSPEPSSDDRQMNRQGDEGLSGEEGSSSSGSDADDEFEFELDL